MHLKLGKGFNQISGPNTVGFLIKINIMKLILNLSEEKISNDELLEFEQSIGYKLPENYKEFILKNNGGVPNKEYFEEIKVSYFTPIKYGENTVEKAYEMLKEILPNGYLPIANDVCGELICIDLKSGNTFGNIYYVADGDEPLVIAKNFEQLLDGLTEEYI